VKTTPATAATTPINTSTICHIAGLSHGSSRGRTAPHIVPTRV
jgi:hypothetical protein